MFSTYQRGINAGSIWIPEVVTAGMERMSLARRGLASVRLGEPRFYDRGITGQGRARVGGGVGLIDGLTSLILDLAHVLLILAGMYMLWTAIRG